MFNIYLVGINIIGLMTIILDKIKSIKKKWRIPEKNLIIISMAGGGIGIIIGMYLSHHKTKHKKFTILIPIITVITIIVSYYIKKHYHI